MLGSVLVEGQERLFEGSARFSGCFKPRSDFSFADHCRASSLL